MSTYETVETHFRRIIASCSSSEITTTNELDAALAAFAATSKGDTRPVRDLIEHLEEFRSVSIFPLRLDEAIGSLRQRLDETMPPNRPPSHAPRFGEH